MKVGTDAVLLGAWASLPKGTADISGVGSVLDIGAGCGVIALMLAQRTSIQVRIYAVEPDENSAEEAAKNFKLSPWSERLSIHHCSIQEFTPDSKYDLIISNPPFFSNSLLPPSAVRKNARHTETLTFDDLLTSVKRLLSARGTFAVVLPATEGAAFSKLAAGYGLTCCRSIAFFTRKGKAQERWLTEYSFDARETRSGTLYLYDDDGGWSEEYRLLTSEFYL